MQPQLIIRELSIPDCYEIRPAVLTDERGSFIKTFHRDIFIANGLFHDFAEEYYTKSHKGVLRGLHFQVPPMEHFKMVYCASGEVFDAIIDIRKGSPAYGRFETVRLNAETGNILHLAPGIAHGFYVPDGEAVMIYKVSTMYSAGHDSGILWSSIDIPWPDKNPVISQRDRSFKSLAEFQSPFVYKGREVEKTS